MDELMVGPGDELKVDPMDEPMAKSCRGLVCTEGCIAQLVPVNPCKGERT